MDEIELKAIVPDLNSSRERLTRAGARLVFSGRLEDRRFDTVARDLMARDHVLRIRVYRAIGEVTRASLDWKGATRLVAGYKVREEHATTISSAATAAQILESLGYEVILAIDREIEQFEIHGATVRFERYPRLDTLVEVEGAPASIERAIEALGLPRDGFLAESIFWFASQFEARTGLRACLNDDSLGSDSTAGNAGAGAERSRGAHG